LLALEKEKVAETHADVPAPMKKKRVELLWLKQFLKKEVTFYYW